MAIVINGSGTVTGLAVGGLPDGTVDSDTLATDSVVTGKIADGTIVNADFASGVKQADVWRMPAHSAAVGTTTTIVTGWERMDDAAFGKIGTGLSVSSGVFSFAETGLYEIVFNGCCQARNGAVSQGITKLDVTTNNSSYDTLGSAEFSAPENNVNMACLQVLFNVTNVSTHKFKLTIYSGNNDMRLLGDTDYNRTSLKIVKLGDSV